jgi:hypothetical protein
MKDKLTPEQIAELIKSASGNAIMASEEAVNNGVGKDYRREMLKLLGEIKSQDNNAIKEAGRMVYGETDNVAKRLGKKAASVIPVVGPVIGAGMALASGEANAASALPILGDAESLGPEQGSEDWEIENPQKNPAARRDALRDILRNRK